MSFKTLVKKCDIRGMLLFLNRKSGLNTGEETFNNLTVPDSDSKQQKNDISVSCFSSMKHLMKEGKNATSVLKCS